MGQRKSVRRCTEMSKVRNEVLNRGCVKLQRREVRQRWHCVSTPVYRTNWKTEDRAEYRSDVEERRLFSNSFLHNGDRCAYTVASRLLFWCVCVCVKSVSCITPLGGHSWMHYLRIFFPTRWISCFQHSCSTLHELYTLFLLCCPQLFRTSTSTFNAVLHFPHFFYFCLSW